MIDVLTGVNVLATLQGLDYTVVAAAIAVVLTIAWLAGRKGTDTQDFFLAKRSVPPLIACLSFVAAEVSAVTLVSVPGVAFKENWQYLQFFVGSTVARIFIAFVFIPVFYKFNCTTIYEFLKHRFGDQTRYAGSAFFFLTRLLGAAVRLYAAAVGISVILNWPLEYAIVLFTVIGIGFISFGGIKAVVWNGAFAAMIFLSAGLGAAIYVLVQTPGHLPHAWHIAEDAGRLSLLNLHWSIADPMTLWAAVLSSFFINMSVFGTDQEFMMKLLTVKTRRSSQTALLGTIVAGFVMVCTYLALGTMLFVFYRQNPDPDLPVKGDEILSYFTVHVLPAGLKGLVLTAILMASLDSPLSSLSASFVTDIYKPLIHRSGSDRHYLWTGRICVVCFGLLLACLAWTCQWFPEALWVAFKILAVTGGSTLGVFLLGILTKRRANRSNVLAMTSSALAMAVLLYLSQTDRLALGWTWLIVIGTVWTFAIGWLLGPVMDREPARTVAEHTLPALQAAEK
jgi:solute:Na+ symporter, SSS family